MRLPLCLSASVSLCPCAFSPFPAERHKRTGAQEPPGSAKHRGKEAKRQRHRGTEKLGSPSLLNWVFSSSFLIRILNYQNDVCLGFLIRLLISFRQLDFWTTLLKYASEIGSLIGLPVRVCASARLCLPASLHFTRSAAERHRDRKAQTHRSNSGSFNRI